MKKTWTDAVASICRLEKVPPRKSVFLRIVWHEKSGRRDPDNVASAIKFILDGLVHAGVIEDDSKRYVRGWETDFEYGSGRAGAEVTIT